MILHPHLAVKEVENFARVDRDDREALVAMEGSEIVGVGRYDRIKRTADAEVGFVVADARPDHGVGTLLWTTRLVGRGQQASTGSWPTRSTRPAGCDSSSAA